MFLTSIILSLCLTNGEDIHYITPNKQEYIILSNLGITLSHESISFKVKARSDVHFALISGNTENDQLYEIAIGGWRNTKSVIRTSKQGDPVDSKHGTFLDDGVFKVFSISWYGDTINVGNGEDVVAGTIFLTWTNSDGLGPILNAGFYTAFGSTGEWIFYKQDVKTAITTQTEKTTGLTSQMTTERTSSRMITDRISQPTTMPSCLCPCSKMGKWSNLESQNLTKEELAVFLADEIEAIKKELLVEMKSSSKYIRTITSAPDDRKSSKSMGFGAIVFMCVPLALIVMSDILNLYLFLTRR
ncbi:uncharacterized protein LOC127701337 [Mytilus californianus]|uniref:uncharacterized protein LOC127701337 n=1 Tax=Mytilus californianus TaxID=6549 RepID=UPI002246474F|nr:uncharacterized protein LOC127701337 [Mytilus californianus]